MGPSLPQGSDLKHQSGDSSQRPKLEHEPCSQLTSALGVRIMVDHKDQASTLNVRMSTRGPNAASVDPR